MIVGATGWLLTCGHTIRSTADELERSAAGDTLEPPRRPRICPVCQRPRNVAEPEIEPKTSDDLS